ncbi:MAG: glycosyltransferase family A protein, partial [Balneolaceae bacterium]|nr:glycosyltransferase family A protein [Balneolaceae bacterium]
MNSTPKVSCLIVTADRRELLKRSLYCYQNQTYSNTELVVVDNGHDTIEDLVVEYVNGEEVTYVRVEPSPDNILGEMRNISLEHASGEYLTCWDDDDWFHPDRITVQMDTLRDGGYEACCLTTSLMHLDNEKFMHHPYKGTLKAGVPPSILHRRDDEIRYPSLNRNE